MFNDVVSDKAGGAAGKWVEPGKCLMAKSGIAFPAQGARLIGVNGANGPDSRCAFTIEGKQPGQAVCRQTIGEVV